LNSDKENNRNLKLIVFNAIQNLNNVTFRTAVLCPETQQTVTNSCY